MGNLCTTPAAKEWHGQPRPYDTRPGYTLPTPDAPSSRHYPTYYPGSEIPAAPRPGMQPVGPGGRPNPNMPNLHVAPQPAASTTTSATTTSATRDVIVEQPMQHVPVAVAGETLPVTPVQPSSQQPLTPEPTPALESRRSEDQPQQPIGPQPQLFFNWTKGKLIGAGAFGRVFQGLDNDTGHILAVKQVALTKDETLKGRVAEHVKALEAEVAVLRQLNHGNIVRYLGTERTDDTLNIFLEYVPGGSIASLIEKFGPLQENVVRKYTQQILQGLEYLHQKKIMHRDIKGANILVDPSGSVKLADFGASRKIEDLATVGSGSKSIRGTPYWMAPEVIKQTGHGRPADIWSLGCVVIEMATGKPPWSNCNTQVAAMFHIASTKEPPPLPEVLSAEARDFLLLCFNRVPKDRPNATRLLRHPWLANIPGPSSSMAMAASASASLLSISTALAAGPSQQQHGQQRHPLVPMLPLQHVLSPPSPIKEEQDTARSAAVKDSARSVAVNASSQLPPTAPNSHRAGGGSGQQQHLSAALHMPLAIGPLEQGRRQSLLPQTAASMALASGLPPLPPTARASVMHAPAASSAAVASSISVPPSPQQPSYAAAVASTAAVQPVVAVAPVPAVPAAAVPVSQPVISVPSAPAGGAQPRVMTPLGGVPDGQYDSIVSPSSIPTALLASAREAAAQAPSQPVSAAAAATQPLAVPAAPAVAPSQPAAHAPAAAAHAAMRQSVATPVHAPMRQSMLTLDYNPMEEPSWMPGLRSPLLLPIQEPAATAAAGAGLTAIQEGVDVSVDGVGLSVAALQALAQQHSPAAQQDSADSDPDAAREGDLSLAASSLGVSAWMVSYQPETQQQPQPQASLRGLSYINHGRSGSDDSATSPAAAAAAAAAGLPPSSSPSPAARATAAAAAAAQQQQLAGVQDPDPVRQSKMQRWREELDAELKSVRSEVTQQRTTMRNSSAGGVRVSVGGGAGTSAGGAAGNGSVGGAVMWVDTPTNKAAQPASPTAAVYAVGS